MKTGGLDTLMANQDSSQQIMYSLMNEEHHLNLERRLAIWDLQIA